VNGPQHLDALHLRLVEVGPTALAGQVAVDTVERAELHDAGGTPLAQRLLHAKLRVDAEAEGGQLDQGQVEQPQLPAGGLLGEVQPRQDDGAPAGPPARIPVPADDDISQHLHAAGCDEHLGDRGTGGRSLDREGCPAAAHPDPPLVAAGLELIVDRDVHDVGLGHFPEVPRPREQVRLVRGEEGARAGVKARGGRLEL